MQAVFWWGEQRGNSFEKDIEEEHYGGCDMRSECGRNWIRSVFDCSL